MNILQTLIRLEIRFIFWDIFDEIDIKISLTFRKINQKSYF